MLDRITLITGNAGKAAEYAAMLGIAVTPAKAELTVVQAIDVARVAARKAADAYAQLGEPVLVDDTGLTIHEWNDLPGALVAASRAGARLIPSDRRTAALVRSGTWTRCTP